MQRHLGIDDKFILYRVLTVLVPTRFANILTGGT